VQRFWLVDPCEAVCQLFLLPDFVAARGTGRKPDVVGSWRASPHYEKLNMATGGLLDRLENSDYRLGFDGVELTISRNNNTFIVILS
jgi:hypothetical protein